ncbi:MAG: class I SAM-dependent methyltransferase [Leptospiraceae bacterium]|nr:class I SAM-dependent methyltransferase [Leptospiraceae bacterium]
MDISSKEIIGDCPINSNCDWKFLYKSEFNQFQLPIYRCNTCGLQAQFPIPSQNLESIYNEEYYTGKSEYKYKDERKTEKFDTYVWDARLRNIKKFIASGNFLDIGASFGGFLARAKFFGFTPFGVEVSKYSAEYAKQRGIKIYNTEFLKADLEENFFDVVTMIEVIEHLDKPKEVFEKLFRILKPNGLLVLQTANFEGKQAMQEERNYHYYLPGHLVYYSRSNLERILQNVGFRKTIMYYGVDFSLLAKLKKSRGSFQNISDYKNWFRISYYHLKSKLWKGSTSSMVMYAVK